MEALLVGALMLKYDTIESTFRNLEPFLNIELNFGYFYYQTVVILKTLYVLYAMENALPKLWILIFAACSKFCFMYMKPLLSVSAYLTLCLHYFGVYFPQITLMGMLAISSKSYEFLLDIYVLLCTLYYATQTYKRETDKLVTIICFSVSLGSYINNIESAEPFKSGVYCLLVLLCLATIFPLLPNRNQYGHRLIFYYMVLITWVIYKGDLHSTNGGLSSNVSICNSTQYRYRLQECNLNGTLDSREKVILESLHLDDNLTYCSLKKSDLQFKNLTGDLKDDRKSGVNKSGVICKYDLNPYMTCPLEVDNDVQMCSLNKKEETCEYDLNITYSEKVDSTEQEKSDMEIKERIDETANAEIEGMDTAEKSKASLAEIHAKISTLGDENNRLEKDSTNLKQEPLAENGHNTGDNPLEGEIYSYKLFETRETDDYLDYRDESDAVERFTVTETSVDDVDYKIEKRLGSAERIDDGINHEFAYKAPEFTKTFDESKQQSQNEKFGIMTQTLDASKSGENFKVFAYDLPNRGGRAEMTDFHVTGIGNMSKTEEAGEVVDLSQVTDCNNEQRFNKTELKEAQTCEAKQTIPEPSEVREKDFTRIDTLKKLTQAVDLQASNFEYKNSRNFIASVPELVNDVDAKVSELQTTVATGPEEKGMDGINTIKYVYANPNAVISLKEVVENRKVEYKAKETELVETNIIEENDAETAEATLSTTIVLANTNQVDEIENKRIVEKENEIVVALSQDKQANDFGSMEYKMAKSRETLKSKIQKPLMTETKGTKLREVTADEHANPNVPTETKTCDKDIASREREDEICKSIDSPLNNHEILKNNYFSESELEHFKTINSKTINLKAPEDTGKTNELKSETENFDSTDRVVSSNDLPFDILKNVEDAELNKYDENAILVSETSEYESTVFDDSETATLQITQSSHTNTRETHDPEENGLPSYCNEATTAECKTAGNFKTKRTEARMFKVTETKKTEDHESDFLKADMFKFTSASNPQRIELEPAKEGEAENIYSDTPKSHIYKNNSKKTFESRDAAAETVLSKPQLASPESNESRETEVYTSKVYLSSNIVSKSKRDGENDSVKSKSKEDSLSGTKELKATETSYQNEKGMDVSKVAGPKEIQLKFTKSRETGEAFTYASEFQNTKNNLPLTIESKYTQEREINDTIPNENGIGHLRTARLEAIEASVSNTREAKVIRVVGPEKSLLHSTKSREIEDTFTETTELQATKNMPPTTDTKQTEEREFRDFTAREHETEVSRHRTEKLETIKASYPNSRETTKPIKVVGPEKSSPKSTEARENDAAFKSETKLRATMAGVSREFEQKPTLKGEVGDSVASEPNEVQPSAN